MTDRWDNDDALSRPACKRFSRCGGARGGRYFFTSSEESKRAWANVERERSGTADFYYPGVCVWGIDRG